ncbi:MAG TPA: DUF4190 domain-containing protein [Phycisphaerae bacterium]|nr:DUF4190 domain-containing protein [Phycisphaerae bacterium]
MSEPVQYNVRDGQGNVYGPATVEMLRQWVREGRIVAGMAIAPEGSDSWVDVSAHPGLSDLFGGAAAPAAPGAPSSAVPAAATPTGAAGAGTVAGHTPVVRAGTEGAAPYSPSYASSSPGAGGELNTMAMVSFIVGIVSVVITPLLCCCYGEVLGGPCGIIAIVLGFMGRSQINAAPERYRNGWMATTGMILGIVGVIFAIGLLALQILGFVVGRSMTPVAPGGGGGL